jgi:hypothetical protein
MSLANSLLTISMITRESLRVLENNLVFAKHIDRQYDDKFGIEGAKIGYTLNIRKPPRYVGRTGQVISVENSVDTQVPLTLSTQFGVDINFSSSDLALSVDDFSKRYIKPAMAVVANKIDRDGLLLGQQVYNTVGTAGTTPTSLAVALAAGAKMDLEAAPRDNERSIVLDPLSQAGIVGGLTNLFNPLKQISDQYEEGTMGIAAGFKWSMDQNIISQSFGPAGGSPVVNGASQTGNSLVTSGWTSGSTPLNVGDVFTIAGVYAVNPQSRQSTGQLRQFVVTSAGVATGGALTIGILPAIVPSGQFQNVTGSPANSAVIVPFAQSVTSPISLAFHKDAFTLGCADLPLPKGVDMAARVSDKQLGMSIRMVRMYDIVNDLFPCRLDVLYGYASLYPELACRIQS